MPLDSAASNPYGVPGLVQSPDGSWGLSQAGGAGMVPPAPPAPVVPTAKPVVAVRGPNGLLIDPTTGLPAPADMPDAQGRLGVIPVIDVGTPRPGAQPGEPGSQYRPVQVGATPQAGIAAQAQAVPPQPAAPAAPATQGPGAAAVPTVAGAVTAPAAMPTSAASANPYGVPGLVQDTQGNWTLPQNLPPQQAQEPSASPPVPASVQAQEVRNQPWYQPLTNAVDTAVGAMGSASHGLTYGLDEILVPLLPAIIKSLGSGVPFTKAYDEAVQEMRAPRKQFEAEHPAAGTAIEFGAGLPGAVAAGPLFGTAAAGAGAAARIGNVARNVAASAGLGAAAGGTMTEGDVAQRLQGAKQGAVIGGVLGAAAPVLPAVASAVAKTVAPSRQIPAIVGRTVVEATGGVPSPATAPIPSVPLNLPQATGSPEAASALDVLNEMNRPAMQRERSAQNAAMVGALAGAGGEPTIYSPAGVNWARGGRTIASRASTAATRALQKAAEIFNTEERRLWNKPSLTEPNVSSSTMKQLVDAEIAGLARDNPALALVYRRSADLRDIVQGIHLMPTKTSASQLNSVGPSMFKAIARDPLEDGRVRAVALRLGGASQRGIWEAPEVVGVKPATQAELDAAERAAAAAPKPAPVQVPSAVGELAGRVRRPPSLLEFLTESGGVKPHGDLSAMGADAYHHRAGGRLVTNKGMTLDYAREAAVDAGYLPHGSDINDLLDSIRAEMNGERQYAAHDLADAQYWEQLDQARNEELARQERAVEEIRQSARDQGVTMSPAVEEHAASLRANDPGMHPEEAVRQATFAGEEAALQANAQRLAFSEPGLPSSAATTPLPDMQMLREGVKPNPELVADLAAARAFTKREAETLGHATFDNILRRNSRGNETVIPGTALEKFFDFTNGVERPGDIKNVSRFLDDIRSDWLKLTNEERGKTYDPASIAPVKAELEEGTRNFLFGKMLGAMSSKERDMTGNRMLQYRQAVEFLDTNRDMLEKTGLLSPEQMDLLDRFKATAAMIQRGVDLARSAGSATFARATHPVRFVDLFTGPLMGRAMGGVAGAALGGLITTWLGEAAIGAMIGAELGAVGSGPKLLQAIYSAPREKLLRALDEAFRNPAIARDLAEKATTAGKARPSDETRNWIRSLIAVEPVAQGARIVGEPAEATP